MLHAGGNAQLGYGSGTWACPGCDVANMVFFLSCLLLSRVTVLSMLGSGSRMLLPARYASSSEAIYRTNHVKLRSSLHYSIVRCRVS